MPAPPRSLPGRKYDRYEARRIIVSGMMDMKYDADYDLEESLHLDFFGYDFSSHFLDGGNPWYPADQENSVPMLRSRVTSILTESGIRLTEDQFEVASALVDEWDRSLEDLLELVTIVHPDPDGPLFSAGTSLTAPLPAINLPSTPAP